MWALPDIKAMNNEAAANAAQLKRAVKSRKLGGKKLKCECADWGSCGTCEGDIHTYLWYDIFSDDPKGILALCDKHDGYTGSPLEGYFTCEECGRVMIENYTWERYESGGLCLNCLFDKNIGAPDNWIDQEFCALPKDDAVKIMRKAKHLIPVEGTHWKKHLEFIANAEFDSSDGHQISGADIQDIVKRACTQASDGRCILILDAAYQFACSVGVYIRKE